MAAGDDAWTYFNAMAAFPPPQTPRVPTLIQRCTTDLSGSDDTYDKRCPDPWVLVNAQPTPDTVQCVFSKAYFDWAQRYVREAVARKPGSTASAKAKILWTLDVSTVMCLGLIATNVPLRIDHPVFGVWNSAYRTFASQLALMQSNYAAKFSAYPAQQRAVQQAVMAPAPFMSLPVEWSHVYIRDTKSADLVFSRIYSALTMQGGWDQFLNLPRKYNNEYNAAVAAGDAPLERGMRQWWLWCVRDGVQTDGQGEILSPLNLGPWNNTPELSWYINTVSQYESSSPELVRKEGAGTRQNAGKDILYPNFATTYENFSVSTSPFASLRFDKIVQAQLSNWLVASTPRVDSNNQPLLDQHGYPYQVPVTYGDAAAMFRQSAKDMQAAADAALRDPGGTFCAQQGWGGANVSLPQVPPQAAYVGAVAGQTAALRTAQSIPTSIHVPGCNELVGATATDVRKSMGPFAAVNDWIGSTLLKVFGAALGAGWYPPVIQQPFVRSFTTPGFRTVADGSSVDVLPRVVAAIQSIGGLLGLNLCAECPPVVSTQKLAPPFTAPPDTTALQRKIVAASLPAFQKLAQDPAYQRDQAQASYRGRFVYNFTHAGEPFPVVPPGATTQEELFAARAKERAQPASPVLRFLRGFVRAGNPIRS